MEKWTEGKLKNVACFFYKDFPLNPSEGLSVEPPSVFLERLKKRWVFNIDTES